MRLMNQALVLELRRQLEGTRAEISHLGSETYHADIKSWSETCEKDAVCLTRDGVAADSHS
jgi:outer membrane lipopolysaccharide assembly protein LptE/RlpB